MPKRAHLRDNLFTKALIGSKIGRQYLQDIVNICISKGRVAYYPSEYLIDGRCLCGLLRFCFTLVAPRFCPFCLGDHTKTPAERFQQWQEKSTLINHIDKHLAGRGKEEAIQCPHPCYKNRFYNGTLLLQRHFFNAHSIKEPRRNCVSQKRKWVCELKACNKPSPKRAALDEECDKAS
ncbi:hypothetical protein GB937_001738 [Aspergillus fischeri]|nr:hypothetical protein GB937_001738 [Aspergillus fischeri]